VSNYLAAGAHLVWNKPYPMAGLMRRDLEQWWEQRVWRKQVGKGGGVLGSGGSRVGMGRGGWG
jgi:hypothetical protein